MGSRLKELRLDKGLSQEKLAQAADISKQTVVNIENGADANVSTIRKLATALNVPIAALLEEGAA